MCLDLRVRALTSGARSLDDAVRALYERTFAAGRGYDEADVRACLQDAAGCDLGAFLDALVHGPFDPDFDTLLAPFGVRIVRSVRSGIHLGVEFQSGSTRLHAVERDGPAMAGGLSAGDEILAVGGLRVRARTFKTVIGQVARAGQPLEILLARRGRVLARTVVPTTNPPSVLRLELIEDASAAQVALRRGWLAE
jgi:predicted metalloprotease with PDZ domain